MGDARARVERAVKLYRRFLLTAYSPATRTEAGDELTQVFREQYRGTSSSVPARVRLWAAVLLDTIIAAGSDRFGSFHSPKTKRNSKKMSPLDSVMQDVKYAFRSYLRTPAVTLIILTTLALGIGASTSMFSVVNAVLMRAPSVSDPESVVALFISDFSSTDYGRLSYPELSDVATQVDGLREASGLFDRYGIPLAWDGGSDLLEGSFVSGNYFSMLGLNASLGRLLVEADDRAESPNVAVLSYDTWKTRFGSDENIVGTRVNLSGIPFEVVGVAPREFRGTDLVAAPDIWVPLTQMSVVTTFATPERFQRRGTRFLRVIARMAPGVTVQELNTQLDVLSSRLADEYPQTNLGTQAAPDAPRSIIAAPIRLTSAGRIDNRQEVVDRARLVMGITIAVLLIACANVASLLLSRSLNRQREIATRMAMGASSGRVARQLLVESGMLALGGGVLGVLLSEVMVLLLSPDRLVMVVGTGLSDTPVSLSGNVMVFALVMTLLTGFIFGMAPMSRVSRVDVSSSLKDSGRGSSGTRGVARFRRALSATQLAISFVLVVVALLFGSSLSSLTSRDAGVQSERVAVAGVDMSGAGGSPDQSISLADEIRSIVTGIPGVQLAAYSTTLPVDGGWARTTLSVEGYQPALGEGMELAYNMVSPDYFETLGTEIIEGRGFLTSDGVGSESVAIVNRAFVEKYWEGQSALGRTLGFGSQGELDIRVVGVVETGLYNSLREDPTPYVFFAIAQQPGWATSSLFLSLRAGSDPSDVLPQVRSKVREVSASLPVYGLTTMDARLGQSVQQERTLAVLTGILGMIALVIACVGVYGVVSYMVQGRTREFGIMSALGAPRRKIWFIVAGYVGATVVAGIVAGSVGAFVAADWMRTVVWRFESVDVTTILVSAAALALTGLVAVTGPSLRVFRLNPSDVLREE